MFFTSCTTQRGNIENPEDLIDSAADFNCAGVAGVYHIELVGGKNNSASPLKKINYECRNGWVKFDLSEVGYVDGTSTKMNRSIAMKYFVSSKKLVVYNTYFLESTSLLIIKQKKYGQSIYEFAREGDIKSEIKF